MLEKIDNKNFVLTCKFKTYLYCVCENLWKSVLEKRQAAVNYHTRKLEPEEDKDIDDLLDHKMYEDLFHDVFETLDPATKSILNLYWQDISPQEIAEKLGYTYGYVRKKKCEGQAELIAKVKNHPDFKRIMSTENAAKGVVY
jgi:RNA polymerase sigma factor (sigma-70 family)